MHVTIIHLCFIFNCNDFVHTYKMRNFLCIMHKLSELLHETVYSIHELRNSKRKATNRRYDRVYRRIYPTSLDADLDIRPYFVVSR